MTNKEKLDKLLDLQTSLGLNSPSCLCQSPLYKEIYEELIQKLECLEEVNKVWHKNEPLESVDFRPYYLQILYDYINVKEKEIETLKNENQILTQNVKDTYDSSQDIIYELQEEIKKLKLSIDEEIRNYQEMAKLYVKESNEREKLIKFIETLKFYFFIDIIQRETDYKLGFEPVVPIDDQPRFSIITSKDGELVEEILNRKAIVDLCFKDTL